MVKVKTPKGTFDYEKSTSKGKKLMVEVDGKKIHFGSKNMEHYKDRTGIWKSMDHGDKTRRDSFIARSSGIKKKDGTKAVNDINSPAYHALHILW